jgi:hypothetical protein
LAAAASASSASFSSAITEPGEARDERRRTTARFEITLKALLRQQFRRSAESASIFSADSDP